MSIKTSNFSSTMQCFMNAVVDPFGTNCPAVVPDDYHKETVSLTDWIDVQGLNVTIYTSTNYFVQGVMIFPTIGTNRFTGVAFNSSLYSMQVLPLLGNGNAVIGANTNTQYNSLNFANIEQITGNTYGKDYAQALVESYRIFSMGIRLWPAIELITDSTTLAVSMFYGGSLALNDILRQLDLGSSANMWQLLRQSEYIHEYTNSAGVTARLDPFEDKRYLAMRTLDEWSSDISYDGANLMVPVVAAYFTTAVEYTTGTGPPADVSNSFPVRFMSQAWIEGRLVQPTPIFAVPSPVDLAYDDVTKLISADKETYPLVVEGHSFKSFVGGLGRLTNVLSKTLKASSKLLPANYQSIGHLAAEGLGLASGAMIKYGKSNKKKKKKKPKANSKQPKGKSLGMTYRPKKTQ